MRLIGLAGEYGWGKDTVFEIIDTETQRTGNLAIRKAFADALKISGLRALGLGDELEYEHSDFLALASSIKNTGRVTVSWIDHKGALRSSAISGRKLWQLYGTEAHRTDDLGFSFHSDFWVDNLLPFGEEGSHPKWWYSFREGWAGFADYAIVPDVRYENEAQRVQDLGGEVWLIDASQRQGNNTDAHSSESGLAENFIDKIIDNNGTLEELELNVYQAMFADADA